MKKYLALLLSVLLMLSLVACGQAGDEGDASSGMTPGKYTAEYRGYKDNVKVETEVTGDSIVAVNVLEHKETLGMGAKAVEIMPERIVAAQSVAVDAVSGATATSMAILAAVKDALEQAGADLDQFMVEPEPPEPQDATYDTDIVIIGGGAAGLSAGLEAARSGAEVILVEKMDITGGNTIRSSGAFNVAGHPMQVEAGKGRTDMEEFIEYTMTGGHDLNDPDLVRYMIENSAGVVDWLQEVGLNPIPNERYTGFYTEGYAPGLVVDLEEKFQEQGGKILLSTKATEIIMEDGAAKGIIAEGPDGGTVTINADAVIIASGGYGANLDMIVELDPSLEGFVTNNSPGATGDGIFMAQEVGAAVRDMNEIQIHPTLYVPTATLITEGCRKSGGILVNTSGERFIDECNYRDVVSAAILEQDQQFAYLIINQEIVDGNANIQGYYDLGILKKFDTIADLADFIGVEEATLQETLDTWNSYVAQQEDPDFNSTFSWIRDLSEGPWYSIQVAPGIHHTMGGIVINTNSEVISTEGEPIPGLYACGEVTGGVHGGNRVGGNAILDCLVFGTTAGQQAAAYVK